MALRILFSLIILTFMGCSNQRVLDTRELPSDLPIVEPTKKSLELVMFTSNDKSFQFRYPKEWSVREMPEMKGTKGSYGMVSESWVISSGEPLQNSVKIYFEIQSVGDMQLSELSLCEMKAVECEVVEINGEKYRKQIMTLNTGMTAIVYEGIHHHKYVRVSSLFNGGDELRAQSESLFQTMTCLK